MLFHININTALICEIMANSEIVQSKSSNIRTLFKYDTEFCADSIEWCPHEPFHHYFVCASYQLCEGNEGTCTHFVYPLILIAIYEVLL